ncbi:DUF3352 domain-containing protein [bacterium]|jgi:hypothetical protein|nr:DUF3352 domain-containing protein [bacterium]MBT6831878.1 DUF3352 domain-containing protein [bacterium]MBT6995968.1 DUF3352 domain-containing protein [bacterium]MBT7772243.1 DUF3352 domain-containing protein [bacterium]
MNHNKGRTNGSQSAKTDGPSAGFWLGVFLATAGILGALWQFLPREKTSLDEVFPSDTAIFSEVSLDQDFREKFETLSGSDFEILAKESFARWIPNGNFDGLEKWIGDRAGIALLPDGEILVATRYRSRKKTEEFLQQFLLPAEKFQRTKITDPVRAEILTPEYSSTVAFAFFRDWLIFSTSHDTLHAALTNTEKLHTDENFQKVRRDFSADANAVVFFNTQQIVERFFSKENFSAQLPVFKAFATAVPGGGTTIKFSEDQVKLQSKFLTKKGVFSEDTAQKQAEKIVPQLAQFAPPDTLLFVNGSDLYKKYSHTKEFLSEFHPQFSVIFDGILREQARTIFGEKFNFETDFLGKMHGQYAFIWDFEDPTEPFLNFTLITGYGSENVVKNLSEMHDVIHFAQSQFATTTEDIKLPDGTIRTELVATDPREIPIEKSEFKSLEYFTAENIANNKKFSYGFVDGYLVFSTHELGLKKAFSAHESVDGNLAQNSDFRESVLFDFSTAGSYGYANTGKILTLLEFSEQVKFEKQDSGGFSLWKTVLREFRNATFARKTLPQQVIWTTILRTR